MGNLHLSKKADLLVARSHRDYVQRVVAKTGLPPTTLATEIGVAPSTLTRLVNEPDNGKATLRATTLAKLAQFSGLAAPGIELPEGEYPVQQRLQEEAIPYKDAGSPLSVIIKAIVSGRKNIDPWTIRTRALEGAGFMPGDVVLVDLNSLPGPGEPALAQVYDPRTGTAETVMRRYISPYLVAISSDPALLKPLLVDNERVVLKGTILPHRLRP